LETGKERRAQQRRVGIGKSWWQERSEAEIFYWLGQGVMRANIYGSTNQCQAKMWLLLPKTGMKKERAKVNFL
jgi:hypothetical protein